MSSKLVSGFQNPNQLHERINDNTNCDITSRNMFKFNEMVRLLESKRRHKSYFPYYAWKAANL